MKVGNWIIVCALALTPLSAVAQRYVVSTDGSEVTDQKTGLIWRRCAEGMVLNGNTCTQAAETFSYKQALAQAEIQATRSRLGWRLPKVRELLSIVDTSFSSPVVDSSVFPSTPSNWFWSASTYADEPSVAKDFGDENAQKVIDMSVGMNKMFGGSDFTAIWIVSFNGKGQIGVKSGAKGLEEAGYVRLVRSATAAAVNPAALVSLIDASTRGDAATVQALIKQGADVNAKDKDGLTTLIWASWKGQSQVVQLLLANGADANVKASGGMTALMGASLVGSADVVKALLANHADVNAKLDIGKTSLTMASAGGFLDVVQMLLDNGADVDAKVISGPSAGSTALIAASFNNDPDVVLALLAKGADINAQANNGTTPLIAASVNGRISVVKTLVSKGANLNARSSNGLTALYAATAKGQSDVRAFLIQAGAKP